MRKLLLLTATTIALASPTLAQTPAVAGRAVPPMSAVTCDALNQSTLICVRNATPDTIAKITCSGFWGASDLSIPHGVIRPGETTIVDFARDKCNKHIVVFTRDGRQYPFDGFDTTHNTTLLVDPN